MADEPVMTQAQIDRLAEEERLKNQIQFDPKVHGAGTIPDIVPESLAVFHKEYVKVINSLLARVESLEKEVYTLENPKKTTQAPFGK